MEFRSIDGTGNRLDDSGLNAAGENASGEKAAGLNAAQARNCPS